MTNLKHKYYYSVQTMRKYLARGPVYAYTEKEARMLVYKFLLEYTDFLDNNLMVKVSIYE